MHENEAFPGVFTDYFRIIETYELHSFESRHNFLVKLLYRASTGLENPGKSLNWKKIQDCKVLENQ
jgi:hypothetical protein